MKIKSLLLLGLMAIFSMNAFSQGTKFKASGIVYEVVGDEQALTVKVVGTHDATYTTMEIPATVSGTHNFGSGEKTYTFKVVGFSTSTWFSTVSSTPAGLETEDCSNKLQTLTINIDNFAAMPTAAELAIPALQTLTLKGTSTIDGDITVDNYKNSGSTLTIDLSNLAAKSGKALKIASYANNANVKEITVPAAMTGIDFNGSKKLEKITGIKTVIDNAFDGCTNLATVSLAEGATIGKASFKNCGKLATINMGVATSIGANAFDGAKNSIAIDLTAAKSIGAQAFKGNAAATLTIPAQVETIADGAFDGMASLATVTINVDNAKTAGKTIGAWFAQTAPGTIKTLTINAPQATAIANNAFQYEPIESLTLTTPKLEQIGANAFVGANTAKLVRIDLSDLNALTTVATTSFPSTTAYTSVKLGGTKLNDTNFANATKWLASSANSLKTLTLPGKITKIPSGTFANFKALTSISVPKSVEKIEANAFNGSALTTVKISAGVETIDLSAFANCADLASVDFSEATALTTINANAFDGDTKLVALDLSGATALATIAATSFPKNKYTSVKLSGTALDQTNFVNFDFSGAATTLKELTLPAAITTIPANHFKGFTALTSVSLPKAVTKIDAGAFEGSGLTAFKVRENVTVIGATAFKDCAALETVNFSEATALTTINGSAFRNTAIAEVALPANFTTMNGGYQFADCKKLKSFSAKGFKGDLPYNLFENDVKLTGIVIPVGTTGIGASAFEGCENLVTVSFRYGAKDAGLVNGIGASAFEGCAALASLDLSATNLLALDQADIFKGCTSLATITFPEELTALGDGTGTADGLFFDCPIEELNAPNVLVSDNLFGWDNTKFVSRTAKTANTTLKTVTIGGRIPSDCFAFCTALETVTVYPLPVWAISSGDVAAYAFDGCTALATFTYEPTEAISAGDEKSVDDDAFHGCTPFVHFATNKFYIDLNPTAPVNASYGVATTTIVKTVVDKANANQAFGKHFSTGLAVRFNSADCKVFSVYVDGEDAYYQACRTQNGYYNIPPYEAVIVKTAEPTEVNFEVFDGINLSWTASTVNSVSSWNELYCSQPGDELVDVQDGVNQGAGLYAGEYLYRLTNTDDQGFGFTYFSGTTVKEGQFFVACSKKPEGAGRLNAIWLDEDGNVIEGEATAIKAAKKLDNNDGAIYNLQGVRVQKAQKGLYIQNGKKIFVK